MVADASHQSLTEGVFKLQNSFLRLQKRHVFWDVGHDVGHLELGTVEFFITEVDLTVFSPVGLSKGSRGQLLHACTQVFPSAAARGEIG